MENKVLKSILEWSFCFILAVILALLIRYYLVAPTMVRQSSMYPTLQEKQRIVLNRTYRILNKEYQRGDIVTFEAPSKILYNANTKSHEAIYEYAPKNLFEKIAYNILELKKVSYIKRIIAVPGDKIEINSGIVYLNGAELQETYLKKGTITNQVNYNNIEVPEGYVFVMGDNRGESMDSRTFGCIPIEKIEGKVWFRYWPFNTFEKIV